MCTEPILLPTKFMPHFIDMQSSTRCRTASHQQQVTKVTVRPRPEVKRHRHRTFSSSSQASAPIPEQDMVGGMLDFCISSCSRLSNSAVRQISDVVQSIAPDRAPRHKIEVSVKSALLLLILGLIKGVLNFVLLLGSIVLSVYTATQVFGWNAVVLGQGQYTGGQAQQQQQQQRQYNQQQQPYAGSSRRSAAASTQGGAPGSIDWQQQQQSGSWQQQPSWQGWPSQGQSDIVDVTRGQAR